VAGRPGRRHRRRDQDRSPD